MDPKDTFKERYNEYLEGRDKQLAGSSLSKTSTPTKTRAFSPNKFYVLGIIAGLMIVGPVGAYLILSNQITQNAPPSQISSVNVKQVSNTQVTDAQIDQEMQTIWGQYYETAKNNPKLRAAAKKNIEIRQAAQKVGAISSKTASDETTSYQETQNQINKDLTEKVVTLRKINALSGFIALNPDSPDTYTKNLAQAKTSLEAIRSLMVSKNESLPQAFSEIKKTGKYYTKFALQEDVTVTFDNKWDQPFLNKIMGSKANEVSPVIQSFGSLLLFQVLTAKNTPYKTLDAYLKMQ